MFRDKVDKNTRICDVYLVESYKKYNQMEYEEDTIICKCNIFWVNLFLIETMLAPKLQDIVLRMHI